MRELRGLALGVVILGAVLAVPFGAVVAGPDTPAPDRELVLGLQVAPPFAMQTPDGIWIGISVELWRHLAEQLRLRFRFEETTQEGLLKGLVDGTLDASGGALTVTAERLREVDFSLPYFVTGVGVAVPLRESLDWIGVAASFLSIRFLSTLLGIAGIVLLVSVIVWLLERRRTAEFGAHRSKAWFAPSAGQPRRWPRPPPPYRRRRGPGACWARSGRRPRWR
jgi:polar amino acid transport system substrate-binding protein